MKNVSRLVLCSLDTISVPPEGNIGGERWQRRRTEKKNKQKKKKKKTLPEPGARQRVAWPLPEIQRRLPSVCLPALSCGSGWQRCWRETPGCQTLFQENLQQIQNKNRQTAGEFGSEEVQEHQHGSSAGAEAPGRWRRFPLGFCRRISSCLDDRGVAQVEVCWRRSS